MLYISIINSPQIPEEAFLETDKHYLNEDEQANRDDGCTAVIAVLAGKRLVVANVGDSRAILSRNGKGMCVVHIRVVRGVGCR